MWCCVEDEGLLALRHRPPGVVSSHLMLRWLETVVVSDEEKASKRRQAGTGKASASEPLLKCRNRFRVGIKTGARVRFQDECGGYPVTGQVVPGM
jgi:hypothetical protein